VSGAAHLLGGKVDIDGHAGGSEQYGKQGRAAEKSFHGDNSETEQVHWTLL
jgi:hypothetical protein